MMRSHFNYYPHFSNHRIVMLLMSLGIVFSMTSCSKTNSSPSSATASFEVTDAPIDDANVSGAFVTISQIYVDGKPVQGFQKTTVNLMAYQNGMTKLLQSANVNAKAYSNVTLVLDYDTDASGNSPGCYVETANNIKQKLTCSTNKFTLSHNFSLTQSSTSDLVFDFDLRKAVVRHETSSDTTYNFVTSTEMKNAIRVVTKTQTGTIQGTCSNTSSGGDEIIAYAYAKGKFNTSEMNPQGTSGVRFANAVTSAKVSKNGSYKLSFLNSGDYELHFASYKKNSAGQMKFNGMLSVNAVGSLNLGAVKVNANVATTVNIDILGLPATH